MWNPSVSVLDNADRLAFCVVAALGALLVELHLAPALLVLLFCLLALRTLGRRLPKPAALVGFVVGVVGLLVVGGLLTNRFYKELPDLLNTTVPAAVAWCDHYNIDLPFDDAKGLKELLRSRSKEITSVMPTYFKSTSTQFVGFVVAVVAACGIFLRDGKGITAAVPSLYSALLGSLVARGKRIYESFAKVIGAQVVINSINCGLT